MADIVVELHDVNIYQQQSLVLSDVSFSIEQSEFVYLIGKTGSAGVLPRRARRGDETATRVVWYPREIILVRVSRGSDRTL